MLYCNTNNDEERDFLGIYYLDFDVQLWLIIIIINTRINHDHHGHHDQDDQQVDHLEPDARGVLVIVEDFMHRGVLLLKRSHQALHDYKHDTDDA